MRIAIVLLLSVLVPGNVRGQPGSSTSLLIQAADSFAAVSQNPGGVWPDRSDAARARSVERMDRIQQMLERVDGATLAAPGDRLLYENLREAVEAGIGTRTCRSHLWSISNQFGGWHVIASNAARVQPVGSDDARRRALAVFRELPAAIAAERALLQRGLDSGFTISRPVVAAVVRQIDDLLPDSVDSSPLYAPAARDTNAQFHAEWRTLLRQEIYPAGREQRRWLADVYAPRARPEGSLATLPGGAQCYAAMARAQTSMRANVDSVLRDARRLIDSILVEAAPLVRHFTGDSNTARGIIRLRTDAAFTFPHRDSVLAAYRTMTQLAAHRFPRAVSRLAAESLAVHPYPDFQERANLPPQYLRASEDGSRPAQMLVNLSRTERMAVANAVAHEGYPGHHLQRIAAMRAPTVHPAMRSIGVSGFTEGWGIYSEAIGDMMGLYTTKLDSVGVLVHLLDVAVGNYLDIGYHTRGWTRAMLVDSMVVLGGRARAQAEAYADRHAALPGQLATYYYGYRAIAAARDHAQRELGPAFRAPDFHYEVLRDGSITLSSMRSKIERWVAAQKATP
jgi:uncharacterized protein (DUF885 family)